MLSHGIRIHSFVSRRKASFRSYTSKWWPLISTVCTSSWLTSTAVFTSWHPAGDRIFFSFLSRNHCPKGFFVWIPSSQSEHVVDTFNPGIRFYEDLGFRNLPISILFVSLLSSYSSPLSLSLSLSLSFPFSLSVESCSHICSFLFHHLVGDRCRGWPEVSLFNSYNTKV